MNHSPFSHLHPRNRERGQGIVEVAILIALVSAVTVGVLATVSRPVQNALIDACAGLQYDPCIAAQGNDNDSGDLGVDGGYAQGTLAVTPEVSLTPSLTSTATPTLAEPDPTRQPFATPTSPAFGLKGLTVFVQDEATNGPAVNIQVLVRTTSGSWAGDRRTDVEGKINFDLRDGNYVVYLYTGQWWEAARATVSGSTQVNLSLKALTVKVIDDATDGPAINLPVYVRTKSDGWVGDKRTNADGKAVFSVTDGGYKISAYTGQWQEVAQADVTASAEVVVHLKALTVKVIDDATGGPAVNIPVYVQTKSGGWVGDKRTNADGQAVFSVTDGGYKISVYTGQWREVAQADVTASAEVVVHLKALTVKVIDDATGGPAVNIPVYVRTKSDGWVGDKRTNADGQAVFSVTDGGYKISVYTGQWREVAQTDVTAATEVVVHLKALTVKVIDDATGRPAVNLPVYVRTKSDGWVGDKRTDANGKAVFSVTDGGYKISVYTGQWWEAAQKDVGGSTEVEIHLQALVVKVKDEAADGPTVNIPVYVRTKSGGWVGEKRTDAGGKAVFSVVSGEYSILVYTGQWWEAAQEKVGDSSEEVEIELKALTVKVISEGEGGPTANIPVYIKTTSGGWAGEKRTDNKGKAVFALVNGGYKISVYTGQWWEAVQVTMGSGSDEVVIHLKRLTVKVIDQATGKSLSNVPVQVRTAAGGWVGELRTGNNGKAEFSLVNGDYEIQTYYAGAWQSHGMHTVTKSITVEARR